jgi:hypothetical protein
MDPYNYPGHLLISTVSRKCIFNSAEDPEPVRGGYYVVTHEAIPPLTSRQWSRPACLAEWGSEVMKSRDSRGGTWCSVCSRLALNTQSPRVFPLRTRERILLGVSVRLSIRMCQPLHGRVKWDELHLTVNWFHYCYRSSSHTLVIHFVIIDEVDKGYGETGSSVSIVSGYGLDDRAIEVRSPAEAKGFFL